MLELLKFIRDKEPALEKIKGLIFRDNKNQIVDNPDREYIVQIDNLPMPAYDLLPMERYFLPSHYETDQHVPSRPYFLIFTSRGCPSNCTFCASKVIWQRQTRFHSAERVLKEITYLKNNYNIKTLEIADDNLLLNKNRLRTILNGIEPLHIHFNCLSRVDTITEEDMRLLKKAGCYLLRFGIESGAEEILKNMKKNVTLRQIKQTFLTAKKVGIAANASFIIGSPEESNETIRKTLKLLLEINPNIVYFFYAMPLVGTELREEAVRKELIINDNWAEWDSLVEPIMKSSYLSADELVKAQSGLYKKYYFRPGFLLKKILNVRHIKNLKIYFYGFLALLNIIFKRKK